MKIAVEIHGVGADRLARSFEFFAYRPANAELPLYSVILEMGLEQACSRRREGNFSYGYATGVESGFLFLREEIRHFLEKQNFHQVKALGLGLAGGDALLVVAPAADRDALADALLGMGGSVLLSRDHALVHGAGNLLPYPLQREARQTGLVPALPSGIAARPGERFRPGDLVIAEAGDTPSVKKIPRWKASYPLLKAFELPTIGHVNRGAAAAALLARSRTWRMVYSADHSANARALLLATHGIKS